MPIALNLGGSRAKWEAFQFSSVQSLNRVRLFATAWTVARQAPLSMGFSRQEYWSELPFPSPGDHPDPRIKPTSLASSACQVDSFLLHHLGSPVVMVVVVTRGILNRTLQRSHT